MYTGSMQRTIGLVSLAFLFGCSSGPAPKPDFNEKVSSEVLASKEMYEHHAKLPNGLFYGDSVRNLNLRGETASSLSAVMKKMGCPLTEDVIREPSKNEPVKDKEGHTSPIWIWTCADGGVVRAKPEGDPTNKFRPQPHASKALRYPVNGTKVASFNEETAKIDNEGHILPKWPKDLNTTNSDSINDWANATHTDLKK